MKVESETRFILLPKQARSLYSLIADGVYRNTSLSRTTWKSLIAGSSLQRNCSKEGFNVGSKTRIGIAGNEQDDCISPDSFLGFGIKNDQFKKTACGNIADGKWDPDNGYKDTKAMCYIFVQWSRTSQRKGQWMSFLDSSPQYYHLKVTSIIKGIGAQGSKANSRLQ